MKVERQETSARWEEHAVNMLSTLKEGSALELLEDDMGGVDGTDMHRRWPTRLLELAINGNSKRFVAHDHCQELIRRRWWGEVIDAEGNTTKVFERHCPKWKILLILLQVSELPFMVTPSASFE